MTSVKIRTTESCGLRASTTQTRPQPGCEPVYKPTPYSYIPTGESRNIATPSTSHELTTNGDHHGKTGSSETDVIVIDDTTSL